MVFKGGNNGWLAMPHCVCSVILLQDQKDVPQPQLTTPYCQKNQTYGLHHIENPSLLQARHQMWFSLANSLDVNASGGAVVGGCI